MDKHYWRCTGFVNNLEHAMRLVYLKPPSSKHATKTLKSEHGMKYLNPEFGEEEDDERGKGGGGNAFQ